MRTLTTRNVCRQLTLSDTAADYKRLQVLGCSACGFTHDRKGGKLDAQAEPLTCAGSEDQRYPP